MRNCKSPKYSLLERKTHQNPVRILRKSGMARGSSPPKKGFFLCSVTTHWRWVVSRLIGSTVRETFKDAQAVAFTSIPGVSFFMYAVNLDTRRTLSPTSVQRLAGSRSRVGKTIQNSRTIKYTHIQPSHCSKRIRTGR